MKKLLLMTLCLYTTFVYGQDTTKTKKDTTVNLSTVTVSGIRGDAKTPITQKTLTQQDISKTYQGQEMVFILSTTPSVTYETDGGMETGYCSFRIRGIDQTRFNITLGNFSLAEPEDQGIYFSNYPDFAINISSVQIQRGVGTSSNGVASFGGSINFEPQTGLDTGGNVQVGYGSFHTVRFNVSNSTGLMKNKFALFTSLSGYYTDGYKYHSTGQGYSAFVSGGYYNDKDVIKFTAFTGRNLSGQAWNAVFIGDIDKDPRTNDNPLGENDNFTQSVTQVEYVKTFNKNSYLTTGIQYIGLDGRWSMYLDETNPTKNTLLQYGLHSNFYSTIINYHYQKDNLKVDLGGSASLYDRNHYADLPDTSRLYDNTGYKNEVSEYLKVGYDIYKFTLFGDVQERYVNFRYKGDVSIPDINWNFINPKGGITYNYSDKTSYYFSVGESHREPTRTDMFDGNDNLMLPLGSTKAEEVVDYELGTNIKTGNLKIQGNLYYMNFHNEITLEGALGSNGLPLFTQVEKSYRSGVELDIKYKIGRHFVITNNDNFSRNYFTSDSGKYQPLYTPSIIVNQGVEYNEKGFTIGISAKYQSLSYISLDDKYNAPQFLIFNGNINYKYKNFVVMLQENNLTNKRYFTNGYVIADQKYYFVNAPFSSYLTIKMNF